MQASPSTHFVSFAQAIVYRGAGFNVGWRQFLAVSVAHFADAPEAVHSR
jgi:ABC-2 type transport system permease protein